MMTPRLMAQNQMFLGIRERIRVEKAAMAPPLVVMTGLMTTQIQNTIRTTFIRRRVCIGGDACRFAERILSFVSLVSTVLIVGYRFHIVMVLRQAALNV